MSRARALPILMYHHVSSAPGLVTISPATFRAQIASLAREGWRTVGLDGVERFLKGEPLPAKTFVITFDDGYLDNFVHAHPILKEFDMTGVLFLVTGWLGDGPVRAGDVPTPNHNECKRRIAAGDPDGVMVRWSEVEAMAAAGTFEFHSHTHSHVRWDQTVADPVRRGEMLAADLADSRETLSTRLGQASAHLCWPQGYYDGQYVSVARERGFSHLYTIRRSINTPRSSAAAIGRLSVKDRADDWLSRRMNLYASPLLGRAYTFLRGEA